VEERSFSDISYKQFLNKERLMGSRCKNCGALFLPPRPICIRCHGTEMEWVEMQGEGKLIAFTCIAVAPPSMIKEGYDREHPYCLGIIELVEMVRVDARIEGIDMSKPETIKVGTPLVAQFLHQGEGERLKTFLAFKPQ